MCVRTLLFYFCDVFFFFIVVLLNETVNFLIFFVGFRGFFMLGYLKEYCKYSDIPNWIITISPFNEKNKRNLNKKRIRKKEKYLYNVYGANGLGVLWWLQYSFTILLLQVVVLFFSCLLWVVVVQVCLDFVCCFVGFGSVLGFV